MSVIYTTVKGFRSRGSAKLHLVLLLLRKSLQHHPSSGHTGFKPDLNCILLLLTTIGFPKISAAAICCFWRTEIIWRDSFLLEIENAYIIKTKQQQKSERASPNTTSVLLSAQTLRCLAF